MLKKITVSIVSVMIILSVVALGNWIPQIQGQATVQTVSLPLETPIPWQMQFDGSKYVWFSGSTSTNGYVVRVDTSIIMSDPSTATKWWEVAPSYHAETGSSYAGASVGVTIGEGYIWSGGQYSGGDDMKTELLSRFNPTTLEVKHYWLPVEAKSIRAIRYDGKGNIWIAASRILKFNIATETVTACTDPLGAYDLLVDGTILWITSPSGIRKFSLIDEKLIATLTPSSYPALLTKDVSGNIWFSMNQAQKIGKIVNDIITEYSLNLGVDPSTGNPYDAPYGLSFDNEGKLWIAGYGAKTLLRFDPSTASVIENHEVTNMPYYPVQGQLGTIWCWGQGSVDMNKVNLPTIPRVETSLSVQAPSSAMVGQSITISGTLSGAYSPSYAMAGAVQNAPIDLTTTWGVTLQAITSTSGAFSFTLNAPLNEGTYDIIVEFKGDLYFASCNFVHALTVESQPVEFMFGREEIGYGEYGWGVNRKWGTQYLCPKDGTAKSITVYLRRPYATNIKVAIHEDNGYNRPGKLVTSGETSVTAGTGFVTIQLAPANVKANTRYFLVVKHDATVYAYWVWAPKGLGYNPTAYRAESYGVPFSDPFGTPDGGLYRLFTIYCVAEA